MIAKAIGRWSSRLPWKSTKLAAAPVTSTSEPPGSGSARTSLTRSRLADSMKGWSLIACTTKSPFSSRCGGFTCTIPSTPFS